MVEMKLKIMGRVCQFAYFQPGNKEGEERKWMKKRNGFGWKDAKKGVSERRENEDRRSKTVDDDEKETRSERTRGVIKREK